MQKISDIILVLSPSVTKKLIAINLYVKDMTLRQALNLVLKQAECDA